MKNKKNLFLALSFALSFASSSFATTFIEGLEDIPIMDGLTQANDDNISFGNEESRFVEVYLSGTGKKFSQVEAFYINTLPQLGWSFEGKKNNILSFYRESEVVEIFQEKKKPLLVRITLKSKG